jgi:hypothetical protein
VVTGQNSAEHVASVIQGDGGHVWQVQDRNLRTSNRLAIDIGDVPEQRAWRSCVLGAGAYG